MEAVDDSPWLPRGRARYSALISSLSRTSKQVRGITVPGHPVVALRERQSRHRGAQTATEPGVHVDLVSGLLVYSFPHHDLARVRFNWVVLVSGSGYRRTARLATMLSNDCKEVDHEATLT